MERFSLRSEGHQKRNTNAAEILLFLHKIVEVFTEYFKELEEESIRDNFVVIYELLDEMMDYGVPFTTEPNNLRDIVTAPDALTAMAGNGTRCKLHTCTLSHTRV